jgi:sporulation protein YlmC with PRC-barrel domain
LNDSLDVGLNVLDHQLIDSEGRRCGKVDDLALEGGPGDELVVAAILVGPDVWPGRSLWLGRLAAWIARGGRHRIPWEEVDRVQSHVKLKRTASELGLGRGDDRLRPLVERIPGADR